MEGVSGGVTDEEAACNPEGPEADINGVENAEEYRPGGYHPVALGDVLGGRYSVKSKLGWGSFSTVWRCEDQEEGCSGVAVKVVQSEKMATAMAKDEVTLLRKVQESRGTKEGHLGSSLIVQLLRNFEQWGPNGKHQCLVLEALGPSLLSCIQQNRGGLPMNKVKEVMSQVMQGLDFLHSSAGIIHTDVKLENILLAKAGQQDFSAKGPPLLVKIADLGGACWTNERFSVEIGTRQYRAPEVLVGFRDYGPGVDVWAAGCTAFELATGSFLFQPKARQKWSKDEDHLRLITETVGPLPKEVIEEGTKARKFYSGEKLKKVEEGDIHATSIFKQLLLKKTWFQFHDLKAFSRWLELLLSPDPRARATAYQSVKHSFLGQGKRKKKEEDVEEVQEVIESERTSGTVETAEDDPLDCPKGKLLVEELSKQKKQAEQLESKLENVVKMLTKMKDEGKKQFKDESQEMVKLLMEVREKVKTQDEVITEELAKLKEKQVNLGETIAQQGVEIARLKEKVGGEFAYKKSLSSEEGRSENDQKLTAENNLLKSPKNAEQEEYEENLVENGENLCQKEGTGQATEARTRASRRCRPDFRHQHSTTKAKKVNWGADISKAGQKQLQLVSPKVVVKMKDMTGGGEVHLKKRHVSGDKAVGSKLKVAKRASINGGILGLGFKVADLDGYLASQVVCGAGRKHRNKACGKCEGCLRENCGLCKYCLDKPRFGGSNIIKQKCQERACTDPQSTRCEACL